MADGGWFALGGAVAGILGKGLWIWRLAVAKVKAERDAREEGRRDKRIERRDDLQRQTMLDVQDAAMDLMRATAQANHHDSIAFREGKNWGSTLLADDVSEKCRVAQARVRLLRSRIRDGDLRWSSNLVPHVRQPFSPRLSLRRNEACAKLRPC